MPRRPPASEVASWPKPNYVNPVTRGKSSLVLNCILFTITIAFVAARLWSRFRIVKSPGLDDLFVTLSLIPAFGSTLAGQIAVLRYGWDRHIWDVTPYMAKPGRMISLIGQGTFLLSQVLTKVSILLFYKRLTAKSYSKTFLYSVWASIAIIVTYTIIFECLILFGCRPFQAYWLQVDLNYVNFKCIDDSDIIPAQGFISMVTDFWTCILPFALVWNMQMPFRQKVSLCAIFALGFSVCILGTLRTAAMYYTLHRTYDVTWYGYYMWLAGVLENDIAIICACAPALKPFFKKYFAGSLPSLHTKRSRFGASYMQGGSYIKSHADPEGGHDSKAITKTVELDIVERKIGSSGSNLYANSEGSEQNLPQHGQPYSGAPKY